MKKQLYIIILVQLFFASTLFSQSNKLDSLFSALKTAQHDTTRFNVYLEIGNYFQYSNPDTAIYYHTLAEKSAEKISGAEGELRRSEAIREKGWDNYILGNYEQSMEFYNQSLQIAEKYILQKDKIISTKAKKLQAANFGNIGSVYNDQGNYSKALEYYFKAQKIDEEIGNKRGQAINLGNIGNVYYEQGNYSKALEYYFKALKINEEMGNKNGQAINLVNIGNVYYEQGNYSKALDYYFKALKINEEIGNKLGQAANLGNIGNVYSDQGNNSKALEYYFKAQNIDEEIGNKSGQAFNLGNIGNVYAEQGNYSKALNYYFKVLSIDEEIGNKNGQARHLGNIGIVYHIQGNYSKALDYYFKALSISEEIGNKSGQAINLGNIGNVYTKLKKHKQAEEYLKKAEAMNRELHTIYYLKDACMGLSDLYEQTNRYKDALYYYKEYIKARDSVMSEENQKAAAIKEMQYLYEKEQALKEAEHQKQLAIQKKEKERQKVISYSIAGGLLITAVFLMIVFNRLQVTRKQKRIIEEQKEIVDKQKQLVEEKNKEITDSINYAKRIQDAILPNKQKWNNLLSESFILYLPKDIVAGDFYWLEETEGYIYVAAADSTGHGVPGAMVSVVCSNALTKAVTEDKLKNTNEILNRTREIVIEKLSSDKEENIRDGMDVCLVRINKKNKKQIQYSGANRPLYIVQNGELKEITPDKQPIGQYEKSAPFAVQDIVLESAGMLYLSTDGYADQFGGDKQKKLTNKKFKELLIQVSDLPAVEQYSQLHEHYQHWKDNLEQVDDVTVIGLRL